MPMVRTTKQKPAIAAAIAVFALSTQSCAADGWKHPVLGGAVQSAVAAAGAEARSFQLAYGGEIGGVILGGAVGSERSSVLARAVQADEARHLRLLAGYDFGPATGYVTLGRLQARSSGSRREGALMGLGMQVSLNRALQLTGELLHHEAGPKTGGAGPRGETLSVSAAFRF